MNKNQIGQLLSSICATSLLALPLANAQDTKTAMEEMSNGQLCQNNDCKKKAACMGYGNSSCDKQNSCKGYGWVAASSAEECAKKKGIWHGEATKPEDKPNEKSAKKSKKKA